MKDQVFVWFSVFVILCSCKTRNTSHSLKSGENDSNYIQPYQNLSMRGPVLAEELGRKLLTFETSDSYKKSVNSKISPMQNLENALQNGSFESWYGQHQEELRCDAKQCFDKAIEAEEDAKLDALPSSLQLSRELSKSFYNLASVKKKVEQMEERERQLEVEGDEAVEKGQPIKSIVAELEWLDGCMESLNDLNKAYAIAASEPSEVLLTYSDFLAQLTKNCGFSSDDKKVIDQWRKDKASDIAQIEKQYHYIVAVQNTKKEFYLNLFMENSEKAFGLTLPNPSVVKALRSFGGGVYETSNHKSIIQIGVAYDEKEKNVLNAQVFLVKFADPCNAKELPLFIMASNSLDNMFIKPKQWQNFVEENKIYGDCRLASLSIIKQVDVSVGLLGSILRMSISGVDYVYEAAKSESFAVIFTAQDPDNKFIIYVGEDDLKQNSFSVYYERAILRNFLFEAKTPDDFQKIMLESLAFSNYSSNAKTSDFTLTKNKLCLPFSLDHKFINCEDKEVAHFFWEKSLDGFVIKKDELCRSLGSDNSAVMVRCDANPIVFQLISF